MANCHPVHPASPWEARVESRVEDGQEIFLISSFPLQVGTISNRHRPSSATMMCAQIVASYWDHSLALSEMAHILEDESNGSAVAPSEFHSFPLLPLELRLRIWEHALPDGVRIPRIWNNDKRGYAIRRPVPAILHVCRETRDWFIQGPWSQCVSDLRYELTCLSEETSGGVYVNWARDNVHILRGCESSSTYRPRLANDIGHSWNQGFRAGTAEESPPPDHELGFAAILGEELCP